MAVERHQHQPEPEFAALVAIDWADQKHLWALEAAGGVEREQGELEHRPETIEVWAMGLAQRFRGGNIAVCLEQSRGALLAVLSKYEHLVIYPVHPSMVARPRKAYYPYRRQGRPGRHRSAAGSAQARSPPSAAGGRAPQDGQREDAAKQPPH